MFGDLNSIIDGLSIASHCKLDFLLQIKIKQFVIMRMKHLLFSANL